MTTELTTPEFLLPQVERALSRLESGEDFNAADNRAALHGLLEHCAIALAHTAAAAPGCACGERAPTYPVFRTEYHVPPCRYASEAPAHAD